jgi:hypothetical protein
VLKLIKNGITKQFQKLELPTKLPKTIFNKFKKSCEEASNKNQKINMAYNLILLRYASSKNLKTKNTPKIAKTKFSKINKTFEEVSNKKS